MTPSQLKFEIERAHTESLFFSRNNMKFAGDTMANFGVRSAGVITSNMDEQIEAWELYRKRTTSKGSSGSFWFNKTTFERVYPKR